MSVVRYTRRLEEKNILNQKNVGHTIVSYMANVLAVLIMLYIGLKYINSQNSTSVGYASYAMILIVFGTIGFFSVDYFDNGEINIIPKTWKEFDKTNFLILMFTLLMLSMLIDYFLKATIRFALLGIDLFLYYVFAGICEEAFYRAFLINFIIRLFTKHGDRPKIRTLIFSVLISSFIFMMSHLAVYGSNIPMFLSTFVGGLLLGGFYIIFRDIGANMISHAVKNAIGYANKFR